MHWKKREGASLQTAPSPQVNAVLHNYKKKTTLALVEKCEEKRPHLFHLLRATLKKPPAVPIQQGPKMEKKAYSHAFLTLCLTSLAKGTGHLHRPAWVSKAFWCREVTKESTCISGLLPAVPLPSLLSDTKSCTPTIAHTRLTSIY